MISERHPSGVMRGDLCHMDVLEVLFTQTCPVMHRLCRGSHRGLWTVNKLLPCWLTNRTCSFLRSVGTELEMPLALSYFCKRKSKTENWHYRKELLESAWNFRRCLIIADIQGPKQRGRAKHTWFTVHTTRNQHWLTKTSIDSFSAA